jgi:hypothetical protein
MASNLSSVPPVCPRPRPEIIGTNTPQAASIGARINDTGSPTPPVECLSNTGPSKSHLSTSPLSRIPHVNATRPASDNPFRQTAMAKAPACASDTAPVANPLVNHANSASLGAPLAQILAIMLRASIC